MVLIYKAANTSSSDKATTQYLDNTTKLNHFSKRMLFLFSSQWCQRRLSKSIRFLEKKHHITSKLQNQRSKFPTETCMQANLLFVHPQARIVPQKKATGPTPLERICDKNLFLFLFSVFTPKCEGKICIKGGFYAPQKSKRTDAFGMHLR